MSGVGAACSVVSAAVAGAASGVSGAGACTVSGATSGVAVGAARLLLLAGV
jgi:hypothetical protein